MPAATGFLGRFSCCSCLDGLGVAPSFRPAGTQPCSPHRAPTRVCLTHSSRTFHSSNPLFAASIASQVPCVYLGGFLFFSPPNSQLHGKAACPKPSSCLPCRNVLLGSTSSTSQSLHPGSCSVWGGFDPRVFLYGFGEPLALCRG